MLVVTITSESEVEGSSGEAKAGQDQLELSFPPCVCRARTILTGVRVVPNTSLRVEKHTKSVSGWPWDAGKAILTWCRVLLSDEVELDRTRWPRHSEK